MILHGMKADLPFFKTVKTVFLCLNLLKNLNSTNRAVFPFFPSVRSDVKT